MTTATATRPPATPETRGGSSLAGTWGLVRFDLRRDRIKLPAWLLGLTLFAYYYGVALPEIYQTPKDLDAVKGFTEGPVGALLAGPGYGMDAPTIERVVVGVYGLYFMILAGLMNILLVSRHTRVEEQTGRAELVRANVIGRHAPLTAALAVAVAANVALSFLIAGAMAGADLDTSDAVLFGASIGAVGLAFAGVAAIAMQVTEYSRAASGIAGAVLGAAYVVRAAGDMLDDGGSALSWFSPIAWAQQTRAYVDGRWWPLALAVVFFAVTAGVGYALSVRRDVGGGLAAARGGSPEAASWLRSPSTLAFRLQRASLLGWGAALVTASVVYGGITKQLVDAYEDMPDNMLEVLGGDPDNMLDGYLSVMALFMALMVAIFVILGIQSLRSEETKGRAEPVLSTATGRLSWLGSYAGVLALNAVALLVMAGLSMGIAVAISVSDASYVWDLTAAHLIYAPAVLVVLGVAALLFGVLPRIIGLTWAVLGFALIIGFFGPIMDLPSGVADLSPFEHIARLPLDPMSWAPMFVLTALAAGLIAASLVGLRRRDIEAN